MKALQTTITKKIGFFYLQFFLICFSVNAQNNWVFDQSFGDNGIKRINFGENYDDIPNDLLLMPNGKILVAGKSDHNGSYFIALTQLLPNGQLDTANFGDSGKVSLQFSFRDYANAIGLQPDGKILLTGAQAVSNAGGRITPSLYRFNADGSLDTTFADSGSAVYRFKVDYSGEMYGVKVLSDGNILIAGYRTGLGAFGLMRFNSDGGRDLSFGDEGEAVLPFVATFRPIACLFLGDSAVVMATVAFANGMSQFALAMMDRFGNPVTTFGDNGIVLTEKDGKSHLAGGEGGESLVLTNDGKILLSGTTPNSGPTNFIVGRFLLDGTIDPTFGNNGWTEIHFAENFDVCYDMKVDSQGRILLVGGVSVGHGKAGLARLNSDGTPDTTFAPEGKFILNLSNTYGYYLTQCIPLDNGDILAAGWDFANNNGDFMVTRLTQNPTGVEMSNSEVPADFVLHQNYPNPFNPSTKIKFTIPQTVNPLLGGARGGLVTLKVYDLLGNEVATLVNEYKPAGNYEVDFQSTVNGHQLASGIYFYRLQAGSFVETKKMILLR
jgi:uncharacterized delta-60 repeat protein